MRCCCFCPLHRNTPRFCCPIIPAAQLLLVATHISTTFRNRLGHYESKNCSTHSNVVIVVNGRRRRGKYPKLVFLGRLCSFAMAICTISVLLSATIENLLFFVSFFPVAVVYYALFFSLLCALVVRVHAE